MKDEGACRAKLGRIARAAGIWPQAIETRDADGIADWNYIFAPSREGWIELKHLPAYPKRTATPVRIKGKPDRLKAQAIWLLERWNRWGKAHALVVVGDEWLLFEPPEYFEIIMQPMPQEAFRSRAVRHWPRLIEGELVEFLREVRT